MIGRGETEATARLFRELRALLDERATARQARAADSTAPPATAHWPDVFLVVDNVGQLRQSAPDLEPELTEIATAGLPFGVHVLIAANRWLDIRPQLLDSLGTRWELKLADPADSLAGLAGRDQGASGSAWAWADQGWAHVPGGPAFAVGRARAR